MITYIKQDPVDLDEHGQYFVRAYFTDSNGLYINTGLPVSGPFAPQSEISALIQEFIDITQ